MNSIVDIIGASIQQESQADYYSRRLSLLSQQQNINSCMLNPMELLNAMTASMPEHKLSRAKRIAAEVRASHPEMQVRRKYGPRA